MNSAWRALTPSSTSVVLMTSNTAPATAQASGLPPYVVPCTPGPNTLATSVVVSIAPIGKPPPSPLARREDVRDDALLHVREERAGAAHAALDLVEDQKRVVLAREPPRSLQECGRARRHPAFALHRLEDHRADVVAAFVAERRFERRDVVVGDVRDAGRARPEPLRVLRLAAGGHGEQRAAMERVQRRDHAHLVRPEAIVRPAPRELERRLVRFGPRVAEEHALGERAVDEPLRESQRRLVREPVADVPDLARLLVERADHCRMAMPERGHRDAAREVDIELAVLVPHARALAAHRDERRRRVARAP